MVNGLEVLAVVIVLAALAYIFYIWSKRRNQIECPQCGARINVYADECPYCGHEKQGLEEFKPEMDEPEGSSQEDDGEHVCGECGKAFDSGQGLNIHKGMQH